MRRLVCWLLGHDRLPSRSSHRTCLRCGLREVLRNYGNVRGWEETRKAAGRA
jgi:hypothetical protein